MNNLNAGLKTPLHREDWHTERFKYLYKKINRAILGDDGVVTAFRDGAVTLRSKRREDGFTFAEKEIGYQGVEPGDLVVHAMDGFAGAIGVSDSRGKCSPVYSIAIPVDPCRVNTRYWGYYLRNLAVSGFIESLAKGIRERSTDFRWKDVGNLLVNFPDIGEQKEIADFLDCETSRIDQLIEKKEQLVKLLDQKKGAEIISKCVGISSTISSVPDKKIIQELVHNVGLPKEWKLKKFHNIFTVRKNNKNTGMIEDNLLSLSYGNIVRKDMSSNEGLIPGSYETYQIVYPGDIVLRLTDLQNDKRSIRQGLVKEKGIVTSAYDAVYVGKEHDPAFWAYTLLSLDLAKYYYSLGGGVRQSVKFRDIPNMLVKFPNLEEQKKISASIVERVIKIDDVIAKTKNSINSLHEFKSSLVTEAVTGQLDIRAWTKRGVGERRLGKAEEKMEQKKGKKASA